MSFFAKKLQQCARSLRRSLKNWCTDTCGNVMMMSALAMPVMLGMAGLAIEGGNWYQIQRKMQNAADAAAIAAAGNGTSAGYLAEARAVASTYGFNNGSNNTTVTASNAATCPAGGTNCYSVTISNNVALIFSKLVGYTGSTTVGGARAVALTSLAVATQTIVPREYCILALSTVGTPLQSNGAPNANLVGCNVMSDGNATCNGSDLNAPYGDAAGINNGCGDVPSSNVPPVGDSYSGLASNIPSDTCGGSYPLANIASNGKTVSNAGSATQWSGTIATTGNIEICGDLVLSGDVTLTGADPGAVIIIRNGNLLTNNHKILTAANSAATIVFTGTSTTSGHIPSTQGTIDIKAPSTGVWHGVALYQDPNTASGVDIDYRGNNPNTPVWAISGLVYMPHAAVSFSGAVNKATNGASCFAMVVNSLLINGNGTIFSQGSCIGTGGGRPTGSIPGRGQLVS
jgi:Flp pilus assembly protein TadG